MIDFFWETTGRVYVDSESFGAAWPLKSTQRADEYTTGMVLQQGPLGLVGSATATLVGSDRLEGTFTAAVCLVPGECDRAFSHPPDYYTRVGKLELTRMAIDAPVCGAELVGDLNGDGHVDFPDFLILSANYGRELLGHDLGDLDCDGVVQFADFLVLSANFGRTAPSPVSVPESTSAMLPIIRCSAFSRFMQKKSGSHDGYRIIQLTYAG